MARRVPPSSRYVSVRRPPRSRRRWIEAAIIGLWCATAFFLATSGGNLPFWR
jgi:hypothetical protein